MYHSQFVSLGRWALGALAAVPILVTAAQAQNDPVAAGRDTSAVQSVPAIPVEPPGPAAASAPRAPQPLEKWIGFELLTSAIDANAADVEGIGSRGWGAQLNLGLTALRVLTARMDLGLVALNDKRRFTEETTVGDQTSGVAGGLATLAVGLRTPPIALGDGTPASMSAGAGAGHSWIDANRSISRCLDCTNESVAIEGGDFWEANLQFDGRKRSGIAVRYRGYLGSSDLRDAVTVGWVLRI